eukprot:1145946-Pelagomonas_calceolata.AAC.2
MNANLAKQPWSPSCAAHCHSLTQSHPGEKVETPTNTWLEMLTKTAATPAACKPASATCSVEPCVNFQPW